MAQRDPLEQTELTFLLGMGFQLMLGEFVRRTDDAGYAELRPIHGLAFQALGHDGATSSELAEALGITKQAAGQVVNYLEERGYVRRVVHPAGGRRRLVVLTDKARRHLTVAGSALHALEAEVSEAIGPVEADTLRHTLIALIRARTEDGVPPLRPVW
ncbi:MarR family transcriptional regulator [Spiractinospora alimapuensis]|uniref:MarR family winged helix-turn-helix transcriptional regulator n=1 Tax=Spiractinospora alimapuensis TaxID=2820884 RepID=UPI001F2BB777|nr:MarR family transcriptional regulator [Spiractinospora alimapuensis]QVQ54302.1 MarR family transcriptional regulator [Spiractinospora alimapuensis]